MFYWTVLCFSEYFYRCGQVRKMAEDVLAIRIGRQARQKQEACDQDLFFGREIKQEVFISKEQCTSKTTINFSSHQVPACSCLHVHCLGNSISVTQTILAPPHTCSSPPASTVTVLVLSISSTLTRSSLRKVRSVLITHKKD